MDGNVELLKRERIYNLGCYCIVMILAIISALVHTTQEQTIRDLEQQIEQLETKLETKD